MSMILDRKVGLPAFVFSPAGGMNIEEVAHKNPE